MLRILRTSLLHSSAPKLNFLEIRSQINTYCSLSEKKRVKSELVVSFFKDNGFTDHHITQIISKLPYVQFADPQKTLAPKFDFFRSLGISNTNLVKFITSDPFVLRSSLKNQLIPCYRYLKSVLHTDENVAKLIMNRQFMILVCSIDKRLAPNISLLRDVGVPESRIQYMLMIHTSAFVYSHTHFKSKVEEVISLGFDPTKYMFLDVVKVLCVSKKTTIDRKWAAYRKVNWSDDEIRAAFRAFPKCMTFSEEKITRVMDVFVNKMGFKAVRVTASPGTFALDLEKRIIPRCRVVKVLQSHGVLKKDIGLNTFLGPFETNFLKKYVSEYEDKVPGLLKIYKGKTDCLEQQSYQII